MTNQWINQSLTIGQW